MHPNSNNQNTLPWFIFCSPRIHRPCIDWDLKQCHFAASGRKFPLRIQVFNSEFEVPMRSKFRSKGSLFLAAMLTAWVAMFLATCAMAESGDLSKTCSSKTLSGDYGMLIEGIILGPNLQLRTVSMAHFDGGGNLAEVSHVVLNGMPPAEEWKADNATYIVNSDCTGVVTFNTPPGAPPLVVHFVVAKHGTEILGVVDGAAITLTAHKVD